MWGGGGADAAAVATAVAPAGKGTKSSMRGIFWDLRRAGGATVARIGAAGKNRTFDPALTKGVLYP